MENAYILQSKNEKNIKNSKKKFDGGYCLFFKIVN